MLSAFLPRASSKPWNLVPSRADTVEAHRGWAVPWRIPWVNAPASPSSGGSFWKAFCLLLSVQPSYALSNTSACLLYQLAPFAQGPAAGESTPVIHPLTQGEVVSPPPVSLSLSLSHTHTHQSYSKFPEKGSDWQILGQMTSLNLIECDKELGSWYPVWLPALPHSAGEGTGCHCDLVRYYNGAIISVLLTLLCATSHWRILLKCRSGVTGGADVSTQSILCVAKEDTLSPLQSTK